MSFVPTQTPPPGFFTIEGIYAQRYNPCVVSTFNTISNINAIQTSNLKPDPFNNLTENIFVKNLSFAQKNEYQRQLGLFRNVYGYNLNQWRKQTPQNPARPYKFMTSSEFYDYQQSIGLMYKLYNVNTQYPLSNLFIMPFPPFTSSFPPPT
jgi:hypothetical protein